MSPKRSRRLLVVAHDHISPAGEVEQRFVDHGFTAKNLLVVPEARFHTPGVEARFPPAADYDAMVLMGAPWAVYDSLVASWVQPELTMVRDADAHGVPVLGICFGGQLIAAAHGGSVTASRTPEIGWHVVHSDDPSLVSPGPWFQWHYDRWSLPPGAVEVARNAVTSQAFVLRRNLAVQFHPELDSAMLRAWLDNGGEQQAMTFGLDVDIMLSHTVALEGAATARAHALVDAFLGRIAGDLPTGGTRTHGTPSQ